MRYDLKLNCINCGHTVALDENVYVDYEGPVKCNACAAILSVRLQDGKLHSMDFVKISRPSVEDPSPHR